jgi:ABC-type bacteriocin/lantibiotic exporter with double-glycine peptidase domain
LIWAVLDAVGSVLFVANGAAASTFVVLYVARSDWRATKAGRIVLLFMATVAAIIVSAVLLALVHDDLLADQLRAVLRVVLFGALLAGIVHLIVVLLRAQRADRAGVAGHTRQE